MDYFGKSENLIYVLLPFGIIILFYVFNSNKRKLKLPPGPTGLPFVGYAPFLGENPPIEFQKLSTKYGNLFGLYIGTKYFVITTDFTTSKQLLSQTNVGERPEEVFKLQPGGVGFGESNGLEWMEQRRYSIMQMKNLGLGTSRWEKEVQNEVKDFLDILEKFKGEPVEISRDLSLSMTNNILTLLTGNRLPSNHPRRRIIYDGVAAFQVANEQSGIVSNYPNLFTFLANFGLIEGKKLLQAMMKMHKSVREEIEETKQDKDGESYVHKYLSEMEKNVQMGLGNTFNEANLIGNVQVFLIAGTDTSKSSILWLFLAMAAYPDIQDKVQEELDLVLGKDGTADWIDRAKLPYCHATILEAQRWRTIAPLNVLHKTSEDIVVNEYDIPKDTRIVTMLMAIHSDPRYWEDPKVFRAERFLTKDNTAVKEPEGYMPFSSGKRICPGKSVALIEIFHYFTSTLQKFRILPASETVQLDMEGINGLTLQPKLQQLRFVPR